MKKVIILLLSFIILLYTPLLKASESITGPIFYLTSKPNVVSDSSFKIYINYKESKIRFSSVEFNVYYDPSSFQVVNFKTKYVGMSSFEEKVLTEKSVVCTPSFMPYTQEKGYNLFHSGSGEIGYIEVLVKGKPNTKQVISFELKFLTQKDENGISYPITKEARLENTSLSYNITSNYSILIIVMISIVLLIALIAIILIIKKRRNIKKDELLLLGGNNAKN
jgi:hypothetical protein